MKSKGSSAKCIKHGCSRTGVRQACGRRNGKVYLYCDMHYRVGKMRETAKRDGKLCPSEQDTLSMIQKIKDMKCPRCRKTMRLLCGNGVKLRDIATLQHNHDGTIEVCCHSCNSRHAHTKIGDGLWGLGDNEKFCPDCETVKPKSEFHKNRSTFTGLQDLCKNCNSTRQKRYKKTGVSYE